ncbi:MAG: 4-alpha-glucanotransferase [Solobacterium sp.]|nr:4-alpha-glucanotransferase [Solobacterium sp.]
MKRSAGILMPITSLPSPYGIGTLGKSARQFVDFLVRAKQRYWQILPIGPTSYGDSPYQSFSSYAGNPYLIDLDELHRQGLLKPSEYKNADWGDDPERVDYTRIYYNRFEVLLIAVDRMLAGNTEALDAFCEAEKAWLDDYAMFMAIKGSLNNVALSEWPKELRERDKAAMKKARKELAYEIRFWQCIQFMFFEQWNALKQYANEKGIELIGDIPVYVAADSADVWADPKQFQLDQDGRPKEVAGVPPDAFTADGQLWGNPLYDWDYMKRTGYTWWQRRITQQLRFYDVLRIDHFRGFESYFAVPAGEPTAHNGVWRKGPGIDFFRTLEKKLGKMNIIAEDLGFLTPEVLEMVKETGYPGMKVLEFAFDPNDPGNAYLPHNYKDSNCIVYAGTHDNDTIMGWMKNTSKASTNMAVKYFHMDKKEGWNWGMMRGAWSSIASVAIVQMQDVLGLGNEARMNVPSTTGSNWCWRCLPGQFTASLADKLAKAAVLYGRAS